MTVGCARIFGDAGAPAVVRVSGSFPGWSVLGIGRPPSVLIGAESAVAVYAAGIVIRVPRQN